MACIRAVPTFDGCFRVTVGCNVGKHAFDGVDDFEFRGAIVPLGVDAGGSDDAYGEAIVKKRLHLSRSLYEILQILSLNLFENAALRLVDELVADGKTHFSFAEAQQHLGRSPAATGNLLQRMLAAGLIDRVRRGHYVIRPFGVLGTPSVAEEVALAVGAAFDGIPHRMAYRTALDEHDLTVHSARSIYVATPSRIRIKTLSGRPLHIVREPESKIRIGAIVRGSSWVSGLERALLDAAMRPKLVSGAAVLAEAIATASRRVDPATLTQFAQDLAWAAALRRIGSIADTLEVDGLAGRLHPLELPTADLDLEPGRNMPRRFRDARWRVRWPQLPAEIANVAKQ